MITNKIENVKQNKWMKLNFWSYCNFTNVRFEYVELVSIHFLGYETYLNMVDTYEFFHFQSHKKKMHYINEICKLYITQFSWNCLQHFHVSFENTTCDGRLFNYVISYNINSWMVTDGYHVLWKKTFNARF